MVFSCRSFSASQTQSIGAALGSVVKIGDVVLMIANLGAGKTTFTQGVVKSLGVKDRALSPTFILAQTLKGKIPVHHLDFYRLDTKQIVDIGIQDYLMGAGEIGPGVVLIEWADRCRAVWPKDRLEIRIKIDPKKESRLLTFKGTGARYRKIIMDLKKKLS